MDSEKAVLDSRDFAHRYREDADRLVLYRRHMTLRKDGRELSFPLLQVESLTLTRNGLFVFTETDAFTLRLKGLKRRDRQTFIREFLDARRSCRAERDG